MKAKSALSLAVLAGVAASATAGNTPANRDIVPLTKAGVMYINLQTGERSLTLYNQGKIAQVDTTTNSTAALFDYWVSIDENPCWTSPLADGFGWNADATTDHLGPSPILEPIVGWDYGDMPFDSKITGVLLSTAVLHTESVDSNGDGVLDTGLDTVMVYYDALSEGNRTSIAPPTAAVRVDSIPGNRGEVPTGFSDYDLIVDFGTAHFTFGSTSPANLGTLNMVGGAAGFDLSAILTNCTTDPITLIVTCTTTANPSPDGLADIQYLQYYAKHATNAKVTSNSTFIGLGTPDGTVAFTTHTTSTITSTILPGGTITTSVIIITVTSTFLTPGALPAGQSAWESFGIGALGTGADVNNVNWSIAGCCFWFGGVDCAGFLAQVVPTPVFNSTYYNFTPYAQDSAAFFSDVNQNNLCPSIDFNGDTILDGGDIGAFVGLFLTGNIAADMNGDGVLDNGDIGTFVQVFLACTG